ncbi:MAG: BamA/TamA family outer membrane protein [Elusimicrobia bacterium]|nr:BamA/TamA family outer membrane protein [Elusimicrobiota bacterium]
MSARAVLLAALALGSAAPAFAQAKTKPKIPRPPAVKKPVLPAENQVPESMPQPPIPPELKEPPEEQPWFVRAIVKPIDRGMFLRLPVVDTDPNRGVTVGFMPIWVLKEKGSDRISEIHAPSITRNQIFKWTPTYRYYRYPTRDSSFETRGSIAKFEHEALAQYENFDLFQRGVTGAARIHYNLDGSNRFFGIGPATQSSGESNFYRDTFGYTATIGAPIPRTINWNLLATNHLAGERVYNGPIDALPDIGKVYPGTETGHRHQDCEFRLTARFESRDHPITTSRGALAEFYAETAQHNLGSEYTFNRYGTDLRYFHHPDPNSRHTTAVQLKAEQLVGRAPFWLLPSLGGKYSLRAYGAGRFIDQGMMTAQLEERFTVYKVKMGGVTTEFEAAPFTGIGTVYDTPGSLQRKYMRPVYGVAARAVAKPQVVGSIDFGVGQEGLAVFMDINYSF